MSNDPTFASGASRLAAAIPEPQQRHDLWTLAILSTLMAFASISTDIYRLMRAGAIIAGIMGVSVAVTAATGWGGLTGLVVPLFLFISCTGLIAANSITGALNLFPEVAGSVSALIGASQFGTGILGSALVGFLSNGTPWPLGASMAFFGLGCLLCAVLLVRPAAHSATGQPTP